MKIIRVFPRKTNATPDDDLVRIGTEPGLFDEADEVHVNSHGAISARLSNGKNLGLKPYEFEIIEWHEPVTIFQCGPSNCAHDYSGYEDVIDDLGRLAGGTSVCIKCGARAIDEAAWA